MNIIKYFSKFINRLSLIGKWRHLYRIKQSHKILKKLNEISKTNYFEAKIINYLRKINPYVFEELVLSVIENKNIRIIRNKKYSDDGGVDGVFVIKQGKVLVQCKRYSNYINHKHIIEFSEKIKKDKYFLGIFVHTGKTGDKAKNTIKIEKNVIIISGNLLVNLLLEKIDIRKFLIEKMKNL